MSEPVDRLENAIAAAQDAAKDLRKGLSRGRRQMVDDLERTLKDARSNLKRTRRTLVDDLEEVGRSIRGEDGRKAASKKSTAPKSRAKAHA
jgi:hypothetical protein